ncbi:MAG: nucleotidyltransferase [Eubacteriales bacterium]|nr:nucleotidyltransferase [Eubacteriales bacterium]
MKTLGMVTEYNPFHNGHLYHLHRSLEESGCDSSVCVMSGNFTQRGEPAIVNKWTRAQMALEAGVDLVVELPLPYAMSGAEHFSFGSVKLLESLGIIDVICFGSECGDIETLEIAADVLAYEPDSFKIQLKKFLDSGISFPAARESALKSYFSENSPIGSAAAECLSEPNNILGVEYLKALKRIRSQIRPMTIKRSGAGHNEPALCDGISGAAAIRNSIISKKSELSGLGNVMPASSLRLLERDFELGKGPVYSDKFGKIILSMLRGMDPESLAKYPDVSEGLENRILEASYLSGSLEELVERIGTKRYALTRIRRILMSVLTGMEAENIRAFDDNGGPQYIRILGFSEKGRSLIALSKKKASLPIIVKPSNFKDSINPHLSRMLALEAHATDIYVLGYEGAEYRLGGQEYTSNLF